MPTKPSDQTQDPEYAFPDADLHFVTSDNVRFKVHKRIIIAASVVRREAFSMDKSSDIVEHCLSDKCFEKSRIVKIWLNLIYHQPQDIDSAQASDFEPLFLLIDKYDCSYPLSAAIQYLRACLDAGLPVEGIALRLGFKHYRIRAGLELGLAALIKHGETEMTNRYSTIFTSIPYAERDQVWLKSLHEGVRANHWDLAILRVTELKQLPVEVLLAWMRANAHHNCSHNYIRHVEVAKVMRQIVTGKTPITPSVPPRIG